MKVPSIAVKFVRGISTLLLCFGVTSCNQTALQPTSALMPTKAAESELSTIQPQTNTQTTQINFAGHKVFQGMVSGLHDEKIILALEFLEEIPADGWWQGYSYVDRTADY